MSTVVLLMAGGGSERMRSSGNPTHKALRTVGGRTLLERNLTSVFDAGFKEVVVAISERELEIDAYLHSEMRPLMADRKAKCDVLRERTPLGNIGAAALVSERADDILVIYVDNLCALDLTALVRMHRDCGRAATFATHEETLIDPYGNLIIEGDEVINYMEKPMRRVRISSGTCVLASRAARLMPLDRATGANELFSLLRSRGERIGAFQHDAAWVDINDAGSLAKAERLIALDSRAFEAAVVSG